MLSWLLVMLSFVLEVSTYSGTSTSHIRCSGESSVVGIKIYELYMVLAAGNAIIVSNAAAAGSSTSAHRDDECDQHDQQASYLYSLFNANNCISVLSSL